MDVVKHIHYWAEGARNDFAVAEDIFARGHYSWGLFIGHLVMEKDLKAIYVSKKNEMAPKTHNLQQLAMIAGLPLEKEQEEFFYKVTSICFESRYPDMRNFSQNRFAKDTAMEIFSQIKEYHLWLQSLIQQ